jgi:uncharacterized protein (DUF952 family)
METIYHLTPRANWQRALEEGRYTAESWSAMGFIHCSTESAGGAVGQPLYTWVLRIC